MGAVQPRFDQLGPVRDLMLPLEYSSSKRWGKNAEQIFKHKPVLREHLVKLTLQTPPHEDPTAVSGVHMLPGTWFK